MPICMFACTHVRVHGCSRVSRLPCQWGRRKTCYLDDLKRVIVRAPVRELLLVACQMLFCSAGAVFCAGRQRRCCGSAICASGVVVLRCFAWNARATVCSSVIVVGPVVQAVCFHDFRFARNRSKSFWRCSPVPVF